MSNTYGRQVVVPLVNKSGGGVIAGDVVIIDTTNDSAFTTTTSAGFTGTCGVAQDTIANNATGRVLITGEASLVNTNGSNVSRGWYGQTHTVAKTAVATGASRTVGSFVQFMTGGTTPKGVIYPVDLAGATGQVATDAIWDAAGDLAVGTGANTAAKLASGAAGTVLAGAGVGSAPTWAAASLLQAATAARTAGNLTNTTTGSWTDLTGITVTLTTGAHRCQVNAVLSGLNSGAERVMVDLDIDGVRQGQALGLTHISLAASQVGNLSFSFLTAVLSAASHTIKVVWRVTGGTGTIYAHTDYCPAIIAVVETGLTA
jgi:hypothetical protein